MGSIYMTPHKLMEEEERLKASEPKYLFHVLKPCKKCGYEKPQKKWIYFKTPGFDYEYYECPQCGHRGYTLATNKQSARYWWNIANYKRLKTFLKRC